MSASLWEVGFPGGLPAHIPPPALAVSCYFFIFHAVTSEPQIGRIKPSIPSEALRPGPDLRAAGRAPRSASAPETVSMSFGFGFELSLSLSPESAVTWLVHGFRISKVFISANVAFNLMQHLWSVADFWNLDEMVVSLTLRMHVTNMFKSGRKLFSAYKRKWNPKFVLRIDEHESSSTESKFSEWID